MWMHAIIGAPHWSLGGEIYITYRNGDKPNNNIKNLFQNYGKVLNFTYLYNYYFIAVKINI